MEEKDVKDLEAKARDIRKKTIETIAHLGVGHVGGSMSIIEVLTLLYNGVMHVDSQNPKMEDRDKLVVSKGHSGPAVYSTLASKGFFPEEWLKTLNQGGTDLPSHCDMNKTPGIDFTTGSLGQGLSAAVGIALGNRLNKVDRNVYCIIGDGESNEGQNWEAAMAARQFKLGKLIAFTDYNKMQIDGYTRDVMNIDDLGAKWLSFGWDVHRVNGHDFRALNAAIRLSKEETCRPSMIIMDTIKGYKCSFAEGKLNNHNMPVTAELAAEALAALDKE